MPRLRFVAVFALVVTCLSACPPIGGARAQDRFFAAVEDLPLMPGLTERPAVVFERPDGRIVEVAADGPVDVAAALGFYERALPQLGWARIGEGFYRRESERLRLAVAERPGGVALRITITPE